MIKDSVLKIGSVISVEGRFVKVNVDKAKNASHLLFLGKVLKNVSVGSYIKITKGFEAIIGKIEGEYIVEDKLYSDKQYINDRSRIKRILNVSLLGYMSGKCFERGIKELPLIGNECFLLDETEFSRVHNFIKDGDEPIVLGHLAQEKGKKISVGINSLFASHIGIFGNTGSGKSYTLAKIYRQLFLKFKDESAFKKNAMFFMIDFNGEYISDDKKEDNVIIQKKYKQTYRLRTRDDKGDRYPVDINMINDPLVWTILLEATEKTQAPFLKRSLESDYVNKSVTAEPNLWDNIFAIIRSVTAFKDKSLDKSVVMNFLYDLKRVCHSFSSKLEGVCISFDKNLKFHSQNKDFYFDESGTMTYSGKPGFDEIIWKYLNTGKIHLNKASSIEIIYLKFILNYYDEIVKGYANKEHIAPLIKRLDRRISDLLKVIQVVNVATDDKKNFVIVSLKDVNVQMRKILPLLFCKQHYEWKKAKDDKTTYLNIIVDEAHNILSANSQRESEQWKDYRLETFEEIIKEGRKFGVFLTIASQRPFDISTTIISQLHNYFLHRLINNNDISAIEKTVSYLDKVSFDSLPILPTGTCILAGLVAQVPVLVEIDRIPDKYRPFNQTIVPTRYWRDDAIL